MFYINDTHRENLNTVFRILPKEKQVDREYLSTAYILALPEIFELFGNDLEQHGYPVFWVNLVKEAAPEIYLHKKYYELGLFSLHLWDGDLESFDLLRCVKTLDHSLYDVFLTALNLRVGREDLNN